jgi:hypothetical protein
MAYGMNQVEIREPLRRSSFLGNLHPSDKKLGLRELQLEAPYFLFLLSLPHLVRHTNQCLK